MWTQLASNPRLPPQCRAPSPRRPKPDRGVKQCFRASSPPARSFPRWYRGLRAPSSDGRSSAAAGAAHLRVRTWASGAVRSGVGRPWLAFPWRCPPGPGGLGGSHGGAAHALTRRARGCPQLSSGCSRSRCTSRWTPSHPGREGHGAVGACLLLQTLLAGCRGQARAERSFGEWARLEGP